MSYSLDTFANKPKKRLLEQMIATRIHFGLDAPGRVNGCTVFSLLGPAVKQHVDNYQLILGKQGTLYSVERDENVYLTQLKESKKHGIPKSRVKLNFGEFFEEVMEYNRHAHTVYLDFDACSSLNTIIQDHLDEFRAVAKKLSKQSKVVWLSVTFSLRTGRGKASKKGLKQIASAFTGGGKGWTTTVEETHSYKDGAPMCTALYKFER
jgi:hypothetical protein